MGEQAIIIPPHKEENITHGNLLNSDFYVSFCKSDMAATSSEEFRMVEPPSDEVQNSGVKNECSIKDETLREYLFGAPRMNEQLNCSPNYVVEDLEYEYIAEKTYGSDFKTSSALHEMNLKMENEEEEHLQEPHLLAESLKMDEQNIQEALKIVHDTHASVSKMCLEATLMEYQYSFKSMENI